MDAIENSAEFLEELDQSLADYLGPLENFANDLASLELRGLTGEQYFSQLHSIPNFPHLFGYLLNGQSEMPIVFDYLDSTQPSSFAKALSDICGRRAYFYLSKFNEICRPNSAFRIANKNLGTLLNYFEKYRRSSLFNVDKRHQILRRANSSAVALTPLHETYVDSELFTALTYLNAEFTNKEANDPVLITELATKIRSIINESLNDSGKIRDADSVPRIKDDANVFWAFALLYKIDGEHLASQEYLPGLLEPFPFEELIINWATRSPRAIPREEDTIFEITPEIQSAERTHLYVTVNILEFLAHPEFLSQKTLDLLVSIASEECQRQILSQPTSTNLYFICLRYSILTKLHTHVGQIYSRVTSEGTRVLDGRLPHMPQQTRYQISVPNDLEDVFIHLNSKNKIRINSEPTRPLLIFMVQAKKGGHPTVSHEAVAKIWQQCNGVDLAAGTLDDAGAAYNAIRAAKRHLQKENVDPDQIFKNDKGKGWRLVCEIKGHTYSGRGHKDPDKIPPKDVVTET